MMYDLPFMLYNILYAMFEGNTSYYKCKAVATCVSYFFASALALKPSMI